MNSCRSFLIIFGVLLASGCVDSSGPQGSVTVEEFSVTPQTVYNTEGNFVSVEIAARNTGSRKAVVKVGENGEEVLADTCDFFAVESFSAESSAVSETRESYELEPREGVEMEWRLKPIGRPPLEGFRCNLQPVLKFNYSATTIRQVQVKSAEDTPEASSLQYKSSSGPMRILIDTTRGDNSRVSSFVYEDGTEQSSRAVFRLVNRGIEGIRKGPVEVYESTFEASVELPLTAPEGASDSEFELEDCINHPENTDLNTVFGGKSVDVICTFEIGEPEAESQISEFSASVNYTYEKPVGERTVEVENSRTR